MYDGRAINNNNMKTTKKYKMRAKTAHDALSLMEKMGNTKYIYRYIQYPMPDVEMTFSCGFLIEELRAIIAKLPNCHVMLQTINHAKEYTGERNYDL